MAEETSIIGGRRLHQELQSLPVRIERNILRAALGAGARVIRDEAKQNVPVQMGDLKRSIKVSTNSKRGTVTAKVKAGDKKAFYAHMVEYGTKAHVIKVKEEDRPINYRLTRRRGVLTRVSIRTINRRGLLIGNNFVGSRVDHPGAQPRPYLRPALDNKSDAAIAAVAAKVRERLTQEGINVPAPEGS